ncbi:uncharacterized protein LAJ45_11503 [Morchella importuna]|uniref:uncharacterized protein n=1 Tax=Morchella importuna TaxID=1174673 RepID=UPI001E8E54A1|nr:uncharacterized protein LAJ45_11503 [Morchella importuna]KAH8144492.1 hypothetical protein LAJ45_11503 [Morchella importuna]
MERPGVLGKVAALRKTFITTALPNYGGHHNLNGDASPRLLHHGLNTPECMATTAALLQHYAFFWSTATPPQYHAVLSRAT